MAFGKTSASLCRQDLGMSDFEILMFYLGVTEVPCMVNAPYRIDKSPSLSLFSYDGDTIYFQDFGSGKHGSVIELLRLIWDLPTQSEVFEKILNGEEIPKFDKPNIQRTKKVEGKFIAPNHSKIQVRTREFKQHDLDYWMQFGINEQWLKFGNVYAVDWIIFTNRKGIFSIPADKYAYVYVEFKDNMPTLKVYQPFNTRFKWMSQHDSSVWDLWAQLPEQMDDLIITKSRKDALSIWANTGIPATALQGEGYIPKEHVVEQLKARAKRVHLLYDNDFDKEVNFGRVYGENIAKRFSLRQIEIPANLYSKDASDLYKNHGAEVQKQTIFNLIKN